MSGFYSTKKETNSMPQIEIKKKLIINLLNTILILLFYSTLEQEIVSYAVLGLFFVNFLGGYRRGILFWCYSSYFIYTLNPVAYAIGAGTLLFLLFFKVLGKFGIKEIFIFVIAAISVSISYKNGADPQIISALLTLSNLLFFLQMSSTFKHIIDFRNVIDSFWIGSIIIAGCTLISISKEGMGDMDRLGLEGSVRDLANGLIFPLFIKVTDYLSKKRSSSLPLVVENVCTIIFAFLLVLTLAKGAIFSLLISIFIFSVLSHKINGKFVLISIATFLVFFILQIYAGVDFSRLGERNYDLNGRTLIWAFYFEKLLARGNVGLLFGFGPGNVNRIAPEEYLGHYYAHSTFLDFFFSYGMVGFCLIICFILYLFYLSHRVNNNFGIGLLFLTILTYSVTGASTNTQIFIAFYAVYLSCICSNSVKKIIGGGK